MSIKQIGTIQSLRGDHTQLGDYTEWLADWDLTDKQREQLAGETLSLILEDYNDRLRGYDAYVLLDGILYQYAGGASIPQPGTDEHRDMLAMIDEAIGYSMRVLYARAELLEHRK